MSSTTPETQSPPASQLTPKVAPVGKPRGRGKNKCYWYDNETKILIDVLQEIASDPAWKTDGGFRSNYLTEVYKRILSKMPNFSKQISPHIESKVKWLKTKFHVISDMLKQSGCQWDGVEKKINHKEANGLWHFKFPYLDQLELVYGRDRATGAPTEGYEDAIHNMEVEQNVESGAENLGDYFVSLTDDENDIQHASQATPTTSNINNARKNGKQKTSAGDKVAKRSKTPSSHDIGTHVEEINHSFTTFVHGFNTNFATMANAVANSMTNDDNRHKAALEKPKILLDELMKLNIPSGDVLEVADIFAANKEKIDIFLNLPQQLRVPYVHKLMDLSSSY